MHVKKIWNQLHNNTKIAVLISLFVAVGLVGWGIHMQAKTANSEPDNQESQLAQVQTSVQNKKTEKNQSQQDSASSSSSRTENQGKEEKKRLFSDLTVEAESAIVWDVRKNKPIYTKNPTKEQPLASLTKLMTALVATQEYTGQATTTIQQEHLEAHGKYGLVQNQEWKLKDLISYMLIESSNDAARAVASVKNSNSDKGYGEQFVEKMNETASALNMSDTYFFNPSGLDINEDLISGGYGTAEDVVRLFAYIQQHYPDILQPTTRKTSQIPARNGTVYTAKNTNELIEKLPNVTGSKTGFTVLAGGNLIMSFDYQKPVIIAVLGSTKDGRFSDMKTLYDKTRKFIASTPKSTENTVTTND